MDGVRRADADPESLAGSFGGEGAWIAVCPVAGALMGVGESWTARCGGAEVSSAVVCLGPAGEELRGTSEGLKPWRAGETRLVEVRATGRILAPRPPSCDCLGFPGLGCSRRSSIRSGPATTVLAVSGSTCGKRSGLRSALAAPAEDRPSDMETTIRCESSTDEAS